MRQLLNAVSILLAVLREVFDEASYARFLQRTQTVSSREAYAEFWHERAQSHDRRQRW